MVERLNPNAKDTMTEDEWVEKWKKFWSKVESVKGDPKSSSTQEQRYSAERLAVPFQPK